MKQISTKTIVKTTFTFVCLFALAFSALSQSSLNQGLMAWYPFNGNANDSSGNGNNPSFNNAKLTSDRFGNANSAYEFDGATSYIKVPNSKSLQAGTQLTMSLWIKPKAFFSGQCAGNYVLDKGSETQNGVYDVVFGNAAWGSLKNIDFCHKPIDTSHESLYGAAIGTVTDSSYFLRTNKWYHVVYVYNDSASYIYLNDSLISIGGTSKTFATTADLYIGVYQSLTYWFNGVIDDIRIYNRAINKLEIDSLYNYQPKPDLNLGLMAWYPFDGNDKDSSGNNNNPTFDNAKLTTDRFGNSNSAYEFDGASTFMHIPNSPSLNAGTQLTMSLWVKPKAFYKGQCAGNYAIAKGLQSQLGVYDVVFGNAPYGVAKNIDFCNTATDTSHESFYGAGIGSVDSATTYLNTNKWYHLVMIYDGTKSYMYVNDKLTSIGQAATTFTNTADLYIGVYQNLTYWLNGDLDDIRIYNRAISKAEVDSLYGGNNSIGSICDAKSLQTTISVDTTIGNLATIGTVDNLYYGFDSSRNAMDIFSWTANGAGVPLYNARTMLKYNLSNIPKNAKINSANLYLYAKTVNALNGVKGQPSYGSNNAVLVQKITSTWIPYFTNVRNLPSIDTVSEITIPQSKSTAENDTLDLTSFVQNWVSKPDSNFGVIFRMKTENNPYNSRIFESGITNDASKRARLEICYTIGTPLPLTLKEFTATAITSPFINLHIGTASELNVKTIEIERSYDGNNFSTIGTLAAKGNAGVNLYSFIDKTDGIAAKVYYRLNMINKDGSHSYSFVATVALTNSLKAFTAEVYPNPVHNEANINLYAVKDDALTVRVFDINGKLVYTQKTFSKKGFSTLSIPTFKSLAVGTYTINIANSTDVVNKKVIKY